MVGERSRRLLLGRCTYVMVLCCAAACGGDADPTGPKAAEIQLNLTEVVLDQRDSVQLIPSVVDAQGTLLAGVPVTFASGNPAIVTVSNVGVVTSIGPAGTTNVQVKAAGLVRTLPVTVRGVAAKLVVEPNPGTLAQKGTLQLAAKLLDRADAPMPNAAFAYESAAPAIATVSATGLVTSVGPAGLASITVTSGSFALVVQVAVTQVATRIEVTPAPAKVTVGRSRQIVARLLDAVDAEIKGATFTYTSNAPSVITVSADGTITSVGPLGSATVTVRAQGTSLSQDVPVAVVTSGHPDGVARLISMSGGSYAVAVMSSSEGYASNLGGTVSRLDLAAGTATVIPGSHGGLALAASRSRGEVYSARYDGASIEIINASGTPAVAGSIPVASMALDLAVSADERTLYAGLNNGNLAIIDLATRTVQTVPVGGALLLHLSLHPTKPILYGSGNSQVVYELDLVSKAIRTFTSPSGMYAQASAPTSDGVFLYVASENGSVQEFNIVTGQRTRSFSTCASWGLRLSPDDEQLIVACSEGKTLIVERATGRVLQTLQGAGARRVALSADGFVALIGSASGGATLLK